jgi:photosystem II stability/assembly factor-like uncharacterized protein
MKPLYLFLFLTILSSVAAGQFREKYRGVDSNDNINGMSFINPSTGFVAFSDFVGFTQDSGKSYVQRNITYNNVNLNGYPSVNFTLGFTPRGVYAFSSDSLLAYGDFTYEPSILFSADQGVTWKLVYHAPYNPDALTLSNGFTDMKFFNNGKTGFAVHNEAIVRTTDRGQTWAPALYTPEELLSKLSFPSATTIYASGGVQIFKSTNGGSSWTDISFNPYFGNQRFNNIFFTSNTSGYVTESAQSRIYRTRDGGMTWNKMNNDTLIPVYANDLYFTNDSTGFVASDLYQVDKTSDYGKTWEPCKKNTNYQFENYNMNALFFLNPLTAWAGGDGEYLMISTDGGQATVPRAYFNADTSNLNFTDTVHLVNYSRTSYRYAWYKNDTLLGRSYNLGYAHNIFNLKDTIKLVVSNGTDSDTSTVFLYFNPPLIISSFTPSSGTIGSTDTISGINMGAVNFVSFGGVPASGFNVVSSTKIVAVVGNGASGNIVVGSPNGIGKIAGFMYINQPNIDLPLSISDSILCKSQSITISLQNTESDVVYDLEDSIGNVYGSANGTGVLMTFNALPISVSGNYYIRATRDITVSRKFSNSIYIVVQHPRGVFVADKMNIVSGETVDYFNYSTGAQSVEWIFNQDASINSSTLPDPQGISYTTPGQKTLKLISKTAEGCADTSTFNAVFVYVKPDPSDACYANNIADSLAGQLSNMSPDLHDGYLICGSGNQPLIKSRYGSSEKFSNPGTCYIAKYTTDGVLKWADYSNSGSISASAADAEGNIYITGFINSSAFFHFNNGDSMQFYVNSTEKQSTWSKLNGFILKVDSTGKYLWNAILYDPSPLYQGYAVQGGIGTRIRIQGNHIIVLGAFLARLSYYFKDSLTSLYSLSTYNHAPDDNQNNFILSINKDGSLLWNSYTHNSATNNIYKLADAGFDKNGNSYITGYYEGGITIYDAKNVATSLSGYVGSANGIILKYDTLGNLLWNVHLNNNFDFNTASLNDIAVDSNGNSYVTGTSSLYNSSQYFIIHNSDSSTVNVNLASFFISKFDPAGRQIWTRGTRGALGGGNSIYLKDQNIYIAGVLNGGPDSLQFSITSSDGNINKFSCQESEFFIARYDSAGDLKRINSSGPNVGGHVNPNAIFIDSKNNVVIGGTADYYNGGIDTYNVFGSVINTEGIDAFYAKLNPNLCSTDSIPLASAGPDIGICPGDSTTIGKQASSGLISWTSNPSGFISDSLQVNVAPTVTTTYYLTVLGSSGLIASDSVTISVGQAIANAGPDQLSCNGMPDTIGTSPTAGNTYSWTSIPAGFISNLANPVVVPDTTTSFILTVTKSSGCVGKDTVLIKVGSISGSAGADTAICVGATISLGKNDSTNTYSWQSSPAGFVSADPNPLVSPQVSTTYFLAATNATGCLLFDTVQINVNPLPEKPVITMDTNNTLFSSVATGNQWYVDTTQLIPGATSQSYHPAQSGLYALQINNNGCKSEFSDLFTFTITGTPPSDSSFIHIFPNPVSNLITVSFILPNATNLQFQIFDAKGQTVAAQSNLLTNQKINVSHLAKGEYIIKFSYENGQKLKVIRFVKM